MPISPDTPNILESLAADISAATAPDPVFDAEMVALIAPLMLEIEGRVPSNYNARFTLNVTNALVLRAKKWYMNVLEIGEPNAPFAGVQFEYKPQPGFIQGGTNANGAQIGLACSASICRVWAEITRRYLAGNYSGTV